MTFNIRYNNPNDGINQWENRKHLVAQTVTYHEADIVGFQEATKTQVDYLSKSLEAYTWVGVGRNDGKEAGEYAPIFWKTDRFKLVKWETIWLSETPEKPSKSWDAALPRIATKVILEDMSSKERITVFNAHYDHIGVVAREKSSEVIVNHIANKEGTIIMGDLNSTPVDEPLKVFDKAGFYNAQYVSKTPHFGPYDTFNGFESKEQKNSNIDHILVSPDITVLQHASLSNTWEGRFASDHYAVIAEIRI
ncbi:endonuclease/exonuclease/phosphatase family protein [Jiulongibacter sp. NS-SX5]|uniref:endonuclease/exonuclease/phosphatase family protein n=1 Tax=Jiulongibacter sp. NS-SX5 TaxID=3463854 RepID=UPI00405881BF